MGYITTKRTGIYNISFSKMFLFINVDEERSAYLRSAGPLSLEKKETGPQENREFSQKTYRRSELFLVEAETCVRKDYSKKTKKKKKIFFVSRILLLLLPLVFFLHINVSLLFPKSEKIILFYDFIIFVH